MSEDLTRGSRLGKYELLLRIGRGGMATVWVALEHADKKEDRRLVAVKAILSDLASDLEFVKMFLDEGRLVRSIGHRNVVEVYEVGEAAGHMYMSMQWVEGESLHSIIAEAGKRRPIPPEMAVRVVADTAAGLHAAHELKDDEGALLGVVHRDVSPHNILVGTDGQIKLVDFGVAKAMGRLADATSAGQLKGKFGYMSPEQATAKPFDRRSDVFSLGIVLFELTTGRRLFRGANDAETLHLVASAEIPRPTLIDSSYPERLEQIVGKALQRDPDRRYQTAEALQKDLESYLKEARIVVPRAGVGGLLKRVLGQRIEQRRQAVRMALRAVGAASASGSGLISAEGVFGPGGNSASDSIAGAPPGGSSSRDASASGVTQSDITAGRPSTIPPGSISPSSVSQPTASGATSSTTVSGDYGVRGSGMIGYWVGVAGLIVALGVVLFVYFTPRGTTTTVVTVPGAQGVNDSASASIRPERGDRQDEALPSVNLQDLESVDASERPLRASRPARTPRAAPPAETATQPATSATQAAQADSASLPRENPYE
jgi:serine/threonine-protein kinase